jgi:hypothetical protein
VAYKSYIIRHLTPGFPDGPPCPNRLYIAVGKDRCHRGVNFQQSLHGLVSGFFTEAGMLNVFARFDQLRVKRKVRFLKNEGAFRVRLVCLVAAPEGVQALLLYESLIRDARTNDDPHGPLMRARRRRRIGSVYQNMASHSATTTETSRTSLRRRSARASRSNT